MNAGLRQNRAARSTHPTTSTLPKMLTRRWRWLACVCLLSLIVGGVISIAREPQFVAKATVRLLSDKPIAIFSEVHPTADDAVVRAQYYVLRSPSILTPVVNQLNLTS